MPSNLIMEKVGARLWIARIMIAWGLLAGATALVTGSTSFAAVRFLGVAEAGFFPGIILYFTYWFPSRQPCPHCFGLSDRESVAPLGAPQRLVRCSKAVITGGR
jgi:MFS family permease